MKIACFDLTKTRINDKNYVLTLIYKNCMFWLDKNYVLTLIYENCMFWLDINYVLTLIYKNCMFWLDKNYVLTLKSKNCMFWLDKNYVLTLISNNCICNVVWHSFCPIIGRGSGRIDIIARNYTNEYTWGRACPF